MNTIDNAAPELVGRIQETLKKPPRKNDELIPLLCKLLELDSNHWVGNVELTECYIQVANWASALPLALKTVQMQPMNDRVKIQLIRVYLGLAEPKKTLKLFEELLCKDISESKNFSGKLSQIIRPESEERNTNRGMQGKTDMFLDDEDNSVIQIFHNLSCNRDVWSKKEQVIDLLRNILVQLRNKIPLVEGVVSKIDKLSPSLELDLVGTIRFFQLQSIVTSSDNHLIQWIEQNREQLNAEQIFIIHLLTTHLGDFPERFKAFVLHSSTMPNLLKIAQSKIEKEHHVPKFLMREGKIKNYLFFLASMPTNETFLRTGAHFKVIADYTRYLTEYDENATVTILLSNELSMKGENAAYYGRWPDCSDTGVFEKGFALHYPDYQCDRIKFNCIAPSIGVNREGYFRNVLNQVAEIEPEVIVWFGGVLESVIFPQMLAKRFPSVFRQFNTNNLPRGHFDVGITYSEPAAMQSKIPGRWVKLNLTYSDLPSNTELPETLLEKVKTETVIITAGNHLINRVDSLFENLIINTLSRNPQSKWILVGIQDMISFFNKFPKLMRFQNEGQIICLGFVDYLGKLLDYADVFVYPRQKGGAGGMALAAIRGLPVLCFKGGDADALFQDEDMFEDYDALEKKLNELLVNKNLRIDFSKKYKDISSKSKYLDEAKQLSMTCQEARDYFLTLYKNE